METAEPGMICRNCGQALLREYCHQCGDPRPDPTSYPGSTFCTLRCMNSRLDSKIFRPLWLLFRRPGLLTAEYWAGHRILTAQQWSRSPTPLIMLVYLFFAVRRLHGESRWRSAWKAILLRLGLFAAEFVLLGIALSGRFSGQQNRRCCPDLPV